MWKCLQCFEEVEEDFDVCWNCGTDREGQSDEHFQAANEYPTFDDSSIVKCHSCGYQGKVFGGGKRDIPFPILLPGFFFVAKLPSAPLVCCPRCRSDNVHPWSGESDADADDVWQSALKDQKSREFRRLLLLFGVLAGLAAAFVGFVYWVLLSR